MTKQEFIKAIGNAAKQVCIERGYGNAQVFTCVAQACLESGYGSASLMKNANAFFGIKATKSWVQKAKYGGLCYSAKTKECYDGTTYTTIKDSFRAYKCLTDSVRDYFDLMEMPRYKACLKASTVEEAITIIKNGGYATSPTYIENVTNVYKTNKSEIDKYGVTAVKPVVSNKKSNEEIADEVIAGLWGNGSQRKQKLSLAGYNYTDIQKIVNQKVRR